MDILIKHMEKPKFCYEMICGEYKTCPFVNADDDCILQLNKGMHGGTWEDQYSRCPFGEAPEPDEASKKFISDLKNVPSVMTEPEPCDDAVSREALRKAMYHRAFETDGDTMWQSGCWVRYRAVEQVIKESPSVMPKQKRGKWEEKAVSDEKVIDEWQSARCSACGKYHTAPYMYYFNNYNFCPNCGARMTEEDV